MIANLIKSFRDHPASVGESYFEHAAFAGRTGVLLIAVGLAALVHAVLPFAFERTASRTILRLAARFHNRTGTGDN